MEIDLDNPDNLNINNNELDVEYTCYICYDNLELEKDLFIMNNELFKIKYCNCLRLEVHKECLKKWINTRKKQNNKKYNYCEICNTKYCIINKIYTKYYFIFILFYSAIFTLLTVMFVNVFKSNIDYYSKILSGFFISVLLIGIFLNIIMFIVKIVKELKLKKINYIKLIDYVR